MSADFLSRWSRRKQEARRDGVVPEALPEAQADSVPPAQTGAPAEPVAVPDDPDLAPDEIAALPRIEDLTPESDLSAFLRKGVPEGLRNAALRRMWSLDPAIRDFVGEARDYAWDWNTPGGVPGTGDLLPGQDVQAMVRQVFGESEPQPAEHAQPEPSAVTSSRHRDRKEQPEAGLPSEPPAIAVQPAGEGKTGVAGLPAPLDADQQPRNACGETDPLRIRTAVQQEPAAGAATPKEDAKSG